MVFGHPTYYTRFGFVPASRFGLRRSFDVPDEGFLALELHPEALHGVSGLLRYPPAFDAYRNCRSVHLLPPDEAPRGGAQAVRCARAYGMRVWRAGGPLLRREAYR